MFNRSFPVILISTAIDKAFVNFTFPFSSERRLNMQWNVLWLRNIIFNETVALGLLTLKLCMPFFSQLVITYDTIRLFS